MRVANVVAIHGTFAKDAKWPLKHALLATEVGEHLEACTTVKWDTLGWSGSNSHREREAAAKGLIDQVSQLPPPSADNLNVLIGHSHGGNVALMALASDPATRKKIDAVVCLSTPFFQAEERMTFFRLFASDPMAWACGLVVLLAGSGLFYFLEGRISDLHLTIARVGFYGFMALVVGVTFYAQKALRPEATQNVLRFYRYGVVFCPVLSLRTPLDEALIAVRGVAHFAGSGTAFVVVWSLAFFVFLAVPYVIVLALPLLFAFDIHVGDAIGIARWIAGILVLLLPIVAVATETFRAVVRSGPWAMGESPSAALAVTFDCVSRPEWMRRFQEEVVPAFPASAPFKLRVNHSYLHSSPVTAERIAVFLRNLKYRPAESNWFPDPDKLGRL